MTKEERIKNFQELLRKSVKETKALFDKREEYIALHHHQEESTWRLAREYKEFINENL